MKSVWKKLSHQTGRKHPSKVIELLTLQPVDEVHHTLPIFRRVYTFKKCMARIQGDVLGVACFTFQGFCNDVLARI